MGTTTSRLPRRLLNYKTAFFPLRYARNPFSAIIEENWVKMGLNLDCT
jgi:hypothetical protein